MDVYKYQWIFLHMYRKVWVQISLLFYTNSTPYTVYNFTLGHVYLCQMHLFACVFVQLAAREKVGIL